MKLICLTVVGLYLMALGIHFESFGSLYAPVLDLLVPLRSDVELGQEGLDINFILDGQKASLEVLGEGQILVAASLALCISASSAAWRGDGPLPLVLRIVADPLAFSRTVFLEPQVLFSILVCISHSNFWLFQHPGREVPDISCLSFSGLYVVGVGFLR